MNVLIDYSQNNTAIQEHVCNEEKCISCFENRGCIYDQYVSAAMKNIENSYMLQTQQPGHNKSNLESYLS
jgi:hypothetical protein